MKVYIVLAEDYNYVFSGEGFYSKRIHGVYATEDTAKKVVEFFTPKDPPPYSSSYSYEEYEVEK